MIRRTSRRIRHPRRGAVLLVVLGLLALFAVVGLAFVLLAESEATGARNYRSSRNEVADPDPELAASQFLAQLVFGTADTGSGLYGHDLTRSRLGPVGTQSPYTGTGVPAEIDQTSGNVISVRGQVGVSGLAGRDFNNAALATPLAIDRRGVVNFRAWTGGTPVWDAVSPDFANVGYPNQVAINKAVPWTYPDRNNFWLAYYDPATDTVTVPSFHRADLFLNTNAAYSADPVQQVSQSLNPNNPKWRNNGHASGGDSTGYYQTLRPRQAEHPNFPLVPANADGTYTGDVCNLKWLNGTARNDSIWLDLGLPVKEWRGKKYKMLVAPLILDLGGKVNLSVAGNNRSGGAHGSTHGWGVWEQNPTGLLNYPTNATSNPLDAVALTQAQAMLNLRYTGANPVAPAPTSLDRFRNLSTSTLNGGLLPPPSSRIDADGWGTGVPDGPTLPAAGGFSPFPVYSGRYAGTQPLLTAELAATHAQSFSPYQWQRQRTPQTNVPYVPSLEDQMRLALPSRIRPKGSPGYGTNFTPNERLTTHFSVSQRWGEMTVPTNTGTTARIAAIDITRPLPDYRTNAAVQLSPVNMGNAVAAQLARQNLARDIFVRVLAGLGQIDGAATGVQYDPTTANVVVNYAVGTPQFNGLRVLAQYAVNMVDQIDNDDISTPFVWYTAGVVTDTVYGTELPKLVLNEVYSKLENGRNDLAAVPVMMNATEAQRVMFWVELHNPTTADPTLADSGAARLQYVANVTSVTDPTTGNPVPYTGVTYPVYQIDIAEVAAATADKTPLTTALAANPSNVALDTTAIPGATTRLRAGGTFIPPNNPYTYASTAPTTAAVLAADQLNVVLPASGAATGADGENAGYYLIGPRDDFPGRRTSMRLEDDVVGGAAPQNAMQYTLANPLDKATLTTQAQSRHTVILRRLANPYLPAQPLLAMPNYNPYIIVDYMENLPLRDRAKYATDNNGVARPEETGASVGRRHPYAAAPVYNPAAVPPPAPAIVDQVPVPLVGVNPENTFFGANTPLDNAAGLAWLAHLDREPVNVLELLATGMQSPARLTQTFFDGTSYQQHLLPPTGTGLPAATRVPVPLDPSAFYGQFARVFDLLGVSNRLPGVPVGGREPGRININTAADAAILNAVLDPQTGNTFAQNPLFTPALAWNNAGVGLLPSRTPNPSALGGANNLPSATVAEGGTDRPFQPAGGLFTDSLFRGPNPQPNPLAPISHLFSYGPGTNGHPSMTSEPLRKGWNNLTTVSDGFLVVFTVAPFEVDALGRLGREISDKVNGDLRAQFAGVVDRSAITLGINPTTLAVQTPNLATTPASPTTLGPKPWETKLTADSPVGANTLIVQANYVAGDAFCTVYDDGAGVRIQNGSTLWVGHTTANQAAPGYISPATAIYPASAAPAVVDGDGEAVRVTAVAAGPTAGTATLTVQTISNGVDTNLRRFHGGGSRVSNAPIGHPGPQSTFDYREPTGRYSGVLPYFMRIVP